MKNIKNKKTPPIILLNYMRFENGEHIALSTMPFYLKPLFKKFEREYQKQVNRPSDWK